jgi:thiosulfate reductase cytochrome b subunit
MDAANRSPAAAEHRPATIKRHRLSTRLWHWLNVVTIAVLLMSGLMILNAHPRLYWGHFGANFDPAWLEFRRPFPGWATIPSTYDLGGARRWHLAFAWVFGASTASYLLLSLLNGHARRDLLPSGTELRPGHLWQDIRDHARLRFPTGDAAARYNILQKLSYGAVIFLLLPTLILSGLAMSPGMNAAWPWLVDLFGGRQSARSVHFICAALVVLFTAVHILMVLLAGPINEMRSMITGRFCLPPERST